jgi:hypothetical protein
MNNTVSRWVGLVFKCLAALALIFAFVFFMRMQEETSKYGHLRNEGVVSRAVVTGKETDKMVTSRRGGRSSSVDLQVLHVRHVPKSTVKFADFGTTTKEADLPIAPPVTGEVLKDMAYGGVMFVPRELYDRTKVGDLLTVVNTPYDPGEPVLVSDVQAFDPSVYHPRMAIAAVLAVLFGLIGWVIGRRARVRR